MNVKLSAKHVRHIGPLEPQAPPRLGLLEGREAVEAREPTHHRPELLHLLRDRFAIDSRAYAGARGAGGGGGAPTDSFPKRNRSTVNEAEETRMFPGKHL